MLPIASMMAPGPVLTAQTAAPTARPSTSTFRHQRALFTFVAPQLALATAVTVALHPPRCCRSPPWNPNQIVRRPHRNRPDPRTRPQNSQNSPLLLLPPRPVPVLPVELQAI